jgi:hypothetical protein
MIGFVPDGKANSPAGMPEAYQSQSYPGLTGARTRISSLTLTLQPGLHPGMIGQ